MGFTENVEIEGDHGDLNVDEDKKEMARRYRGAFRSDQLSNLMKLYDTNNDALFKPVTIHGDTVFHIAAYRGDVRLLNYLLDKLPSNRVREVLSRKNIYGNTPLHDAANYRRNINAAVILVRKLLVAEEGTRRVHEEDMRVREELLKVRNNLGETPLYKAAALGNKELLKHLVAEARLIGDMKDHFHRNDQFSILHIAIVGQHFDVALWLLENYGELFSMKDEQNYMIVSSLCLLAAMPTAFKSSCPREGLEAFIYFCLPKLLHSDKDDDQEQEKNKRFNFLWRCLGCLNIFKAIPKAYRVFWERAAEEYKTVQITKELKEKHELADELAKILVEKDTSWTVSHKIYNNTICIGEDQSQAASEVDKIFYTKTTSSLETPLLIAASRGIQEIVTWTFKTYPQAIEHINSAGQNMLHIAIRYRQHNIFHMVREDDIATVERLAMNIDNNGYTVLHHAADTSCYLGGTQPGAALQLQEELEWFEKVKKIIPSHFEMHRNKDGITAEKLFEISHEKQYNEAKEWVQSIAQSCSTVAVLVATVVFAAAFTVPGGFRGEEDEGSQTTDPDKKEGLPILLNKPLYSLFTVMDVASLAASLTSLVLFLSILTSSMEKKDFYHSLPRRLTFAFNFLFFSVAAAMMAFTSTILLTIQPRDSLVKTLNLVAAFIPIAVFIVAQYPLYAVFYRVLRTNCRYICKIILPKKCEDLIFRHRRSAPVT